MLPVNGQYLLILAAVDGVFYKPKGQILVGASARGYKFGNTVVLPPPSNTLSSRDNRASNIIVRRMLDIRLQRHELFVCAPCHPPAASARDVPSLFWFRLKQQLTFCTRSPSYMHEIVNIDFRV